MPLPKNLNISYIPKKSDQLTIKIIPTLTRECKKKEFIGKFEVSPEVAQFLLEKHNPINRTLNQISVESLARDMKNGKWQGHVGDEVTIDRDGNLNNGQHRLAAIVASGLSQDMSFRFGVDPETRLVEGRGRIKQFSDYLSMTNSQGMAYRNNHAATIRLLFGFIHDQYRPQVYSGNAKPTNSELNDVNEAFGAELYDSLCFVLDHKIGKVTVESNAALLHFLFKRSENGHLADEFMEALATGVNMNGDDPRLIIRNRLSGDRTLRQQCNKDKAMGLIVKAWNAWVNKKKWTTKERNPSEMLKIDGLTNVGSHALYVEPESQV